MKYGLGEHVGVCRLPVVVTRAQYALGLCVCVRLYVCVCGQKTHLFTSHRSKFATKVHFAASSLNL